MINTYAHLDGTKVLSLIPSEEIEELPFITEGNMFWPEPPFPGAVLYFINDALVWQDERTLEQAKFLQWEKLKVARNTAINADMTTPFGVFQCRDEDRKNITDAVMLAQTMLSAGQPVSIEWTLSDNSVAVLTGAEMVTVGLLLGQKVQGAYAIARGLREQIQTAETISAVNEVTWPVNTETLEQV